MKKKENNNLILLSFSDGRKIYFTSMNRAGKHIGLTQASIRWSIDHNTSMKTNGDAEVYATIVDGSEIPYKLINN